MTAPSFVSRAPPAADVKPDLARLVASHDEIRVEQCRAKATQQRLHAEIRSQLGGHVERREEAEHGPRGRANLRGRVIEVRGREKHLGGGWSGWGWKRRFGDKRAREEMRARE